jgi:hypothetical protein
MPPQGKGQHFANNFEKMEMVVCLFYDQTGSLRVVADTSCNVIKEVLYDPTGDSGGDSDWYGYCLDDPAMGLFKFGKRALSGPLSGFEGLGSEGGWLDENNLELKHEQGFYEDGSGDNIGFSKDGMLRDERVNEYQLGERQWDDSRMRRSEKTTPEGQYNVFQNNCQDYADRLKKRYQQLERWDRQR